jgi:hypothetical protein
MNTVTPAVLNTFAADLVRRGLPVDYAQRAASEIADHHRDLVAELSASGVDEPSAEIEAISRLGSPHTLVKKTVREYQRRFWCGRWPLLTFSFGPLVLLVAYFVAMVLVAYCILLPLEKLGIRMDQTVDGVVTQSEYVAAIVGRVLILYFGPAISLLILARLARKAAMRTTWLWLSTSILMVIACCIWSGFAGETRMNLPADMGVLAVGVPVRRFAQDPLYVGQCLLPVLIGTGMVLRMRRQWRRAELLMLGAHSQGGTHEYAKCA